MQSGYKVSLGLAIVGFGVACYSMLSTAAGVGARAAARPGTVPLLYLLYLLYLAISPRRVTHCSEHAVCDTRSSNTSKAVCNTRCSTGVRGATCVPLRTALLALLALLSAWY